MHRIIGVTNLQRRFRTILDEVVGEHVPYVLTAAAGPKQPSFPMTNSRNFWPGRNKVSCASLTS